MRLVQRAAKAGKRGGLWGRPATRLAAWDRAALGVSGGIFPLGPVPRDGVLWSGFHKGGTPLCPGSGGRQPLGRTASGGESRDSKGRRLSPFSAEHRLRCITALFVAFRSVLWRGRRGSKQAEAFLLFSVVDSNGRSLAKWLSEPISARLKLWILIYCSTWEEFCDW